MVIIEIVLGTKGRQTREDEAHNRDDHANVDEAFAEGADVLDRVKEVAVGHVVSEVPLYG